LNLSWQLLSHNYSEYFSSGGSTMNECSYNATTLLVDRYRNNIVNIEAWKIHWYSCWQQFTFKKSQWERLAG